MLDKLLAGWRLTVTGLWLIMVDKLDSTELFCISEKQSCGEDSSSRGGAGAAGVWGNPGTLAAWWLLTLHCNHHNISNITSLSDHHQQIVMYLESIHLNSILKKLLSTFTSQIKTHHDYKDTRKIIVDMQSWTGMPINIANQGSID